MDFALARENMVKSQLRTNHITNDDVIRAFNKVPREDFIPEAFRESAYLDENIKLSNGRFMLEPLLAAHFVQSAALKADDQVLVLGATTGYETALIAEFTHSIIALESDLSLRKSMEAILAHHDKEYVAVIEKDYTQGYEDEAPFDVIVILGGVPSFPEHIAAQLRDGGRLIYIERSEHAAGQLMCYTKSGDGFAHQMIRTAQTPILKGFETKKTFNF